MPSRAQARLALQVGAPSPKAAWADPGAFADGHWQPGQGGQPGVHYVAGGHFFETGAAFEIPDVR